MPELRAMLAAGGFADPRTYLQSGNVVLRSDAAPEVVASECERLVAAAFGLRIDVVARTRDELAEVVRRDPLAGVASDPKRCQVSFLAHDLDPAVIGKLSSATVEPERFVVLGREIYAWHPDGIAQSRLWNLLAGQGLGVKATARNWTTVTTLLAMADE